MGTRAVCGLMESQAAPHGEVSIKGLFGLPSSAHAARDRYEREYPVQGYGTSLTIHRDNDGYWIVSGTRSASCD